MYGQLDNSTVLRLEETFMILEECLQCDDTPFPISTIKPHHVQRLKKFYSPQFDFEFSESGSYFYAALKVASASSLKSEPAEFYFLSDQFKRSLEYLLQVSLLSLNYQNNQHRITEQLILLADLWQLHDTLDMQLLVINVLSKMRAELTERYQS